MLVSLSSCEKKHISEHVDLTASSNLAVSEKWAIINTVYVAFRTTYDIDAEIKAHGRLGDICCIRAHHITQAGESWYQFDKGWLPAPFITIFNNKLQATCAAHKIKKD
ncbi:MAG TPA: hypothetical protein VFC68_05735 [Treponemataceae bacterium]|nr:hypothetical protein [Treponemataceae bacterium]